jgi:alanyl-tRNA synthetase
MRVSAAALVCLVLFACDAGTKKKRPSSDDDDDARKTKTSKTSKASSEKSAKLDEYTIKGIQFVYFKVPAGLSREQLIETAQKLHEQEPKAQLVLVDDDSKLEEYVTYVKAISGQGELNEPMPQEWADKHIVANVQLYMNGKFVLCEGNGSKEIAELK